MIDIFTKFKLGAAHERKHTWLWWGRGGGGGGSGPHPTSHPTPPPKAHPPSHPPKPGRKPSIAIAPNWNEGRQGGWWEARPTARNYKLASKARVAK